MDKQSPRVVAYAFLLHFVFNFGLPAFAGFVVATFGFHAIKLWTHNLLTVPALLYEVAWTMIGIPLRAINSFRLSGVGEPFHVLPTIAQSASSLLTLRLRQLGVGAAEAHLRGEDLRMEIEAVEPTWEFATAAMQVVEAHREHPGAAEALAIAMQALYGQALMQFREPEELRALAIQMETFMSRRIDRALRFMAMQQPQDPWMDVLAPEVALALEPPGLSVG